MKLIELSCNNSSFKTINFKPSGVTIIKGTRSDNERSSVNGVGKTLAAKLVNYCLGSRKTIDVLRKNVPDWIFELTFSLNGVTHCIERKADNSLLALNEEKIKYTDLIRWFNENGSFAIPEDITSVTFRSLLSRFLRTSNEDCVDPIKTNKEQDCEALLRNLFLLGGDYHLAQEKIRLKKEYDRLTSEQRAFQNNEILSKILRSGTNPRVRLNSLEQTISSLEQDINNLNVADNYRLIEQQADEETQKMRNLEKDIAILKFQITEVEKSMQDTPDITNEQLLQMYSGLKMIFKQEALEHFDSVERFHFSLAKRRKQYLERDKQKLLLEKQEKEMSYEQVSQVRDSYLKQLEGKKALDDYSVLVNELAKLKEEKNRLLEYVNFEDINNSAKLSIKSQITLNDENANEYTNREPLYEYDRMFRVLSSMLYPHHDAGIILENNTGFNQQKFNLIVQIQGHDSDGINEARIVLYDWLLLTKGINHHMKFLWHDSRLFANIDEFARARWFEYVLEEAKQQDKQYIATINTENYETTYATLTEEKRQLLDEAVCLELTQDNNLLGKTLTN